MSAVDTRFVFEDVNRGNIKARKRLVTGTEIRYYKPRGDPTQFVPGQQVDFLVAPGPFFISNLNHIEVKLLVKQRDKPTQQNPNEAFLKATDNDYKTVNVVENFGSRLFEEVVYRNGENEQKTNNSFIQRGGRSLWEAFLLSHMDKDARAYYNFSKNDTGSTVTLETNGFSNIVTNDANYKAFYTAFSAYPTGYTVRVAPMCFPFEVQNRSKQNDLFFPHITNDGVIGLTINRNFESLYKSTSLELEIEIKSIKLALATPRLTREGSDLVRSSSGPSMIRFPGNRITQEVFFTGNNQRNMKLKINRKTLPNAVLIQFFEDQYFTNDYTFGDAKENVAYPMEPNVEKVIVTFDGYDMFQHLTPLNFENQFAEIMRQNILRYGETLLGVTKTNKDYFYENTNYAQKHLFLSFESDLKNHETLLPLDFKEDQPLNPLQRRDRILEITMEGKRPKGLPDNARVVVTLIDINQGAVYNMRDGTLN